MSFNANAYINGRFYSDELSYGDSPSDIGKAIVKALLNGSEVPDINWGVTVNYLLGMFRYTGKTGEFYDVLDDTTDHNYDPNVATPGGDWGEVRHLRALARHAAFESRDVRDSAVLRELSPRYAALAAEYTEAADAMDKSKLGLRPLRAGLTVPKAKLWNKRIGSDAIWWDDKANVFRFGGYYVGVNLLGRIIVTTLLRGEEWARVGDFDVTVNYLVQMCREVGKHGEFFDYNDDEFDGNEAPDMAA